MLRRVTLFGGILRPNIIRCFGSGKRSKASKLEDDESVSKKLPKYVIYGGNGLEVDLVSAESDMVKAIDYLQRELGKLRVGRANPSLIEGLKLKNDAGGLAIPISQLGSIMVKDAQTLVMNLYDPSNGKNVVSTLMQAGLDLNAFLEGSKVTINLPKMTKELREKMAKGLGEYADSSKRAIRDIRATLISSTNSTIKDLDLKRRAEREAQKIYNDMTKKVDDILEFKRKEILNA